MLKPSACCVWQTTRHSYLQPWPVKKPKRKHMNAACKCITWFILYSVMSERLITWSSNSFPFGSMAESCLNASSPTKQISWPSYIMWRTESAKRTFGKYSTITLHNKFSQDLQEWRLPLWLFQVCPDSQEEWGFCAFLFSLGPQCLVTAKQTLFIKITPSKIWCGCWFWVNYLTWSRGQANAILPKAVPCSTAPPMSCNSSLHYKSKVCGQ